MDKSQYRAMRDIMCGLVFAFVGMDKGHKRLLKSTITDADIDRFLADIDQITAASSGPQAGRYVLEEDDIEIEIAEAAITDGERADRTESEDENER